MNFLVLESSTTDNYISGHGEVGPQLIWGCFIMDGEIAGGCTEDNFFTHPGVKVPIAILTTWLEQRS